MTISLGPLTFTAGISELAGSVCALGVMAFIALAAAVMFARWAGRISPGPWFDQ